MKALITHGLASDDLASRSGVESFMLPEIAKGAFLVFFERVTGLLRELYLFFLVILSIFMG